MKRQNFKIYKIYKNKYIFLILFIYIGLASLFYYLIGEQLYFRDSRGNISLIPAESGTIELVQGRKVEQFFTPYTQRLEKCSVQWGTYMRPNIGRAKVQLIDTRDSSVLMEKQIDVSTITEGAIVELTADTPIETVYSAPLVIRVTADSSVGSAISPMMSSSIQREGESLYINGEQINGTLCFSVSGKDYIWMGLHYWKIIIFCGILLMICCYIIVYRINNGKQSCVACALLSIRKYRFLIRQLVSRDFKTKYKRSVLGVLWSFLNPLLMMTVQYFVFSTIFKTDISNYPVYLLIGIISFNFFSEASSMALMSILGNSTLITKVYMPKYIYPLTRVMSSVINLAISLVPLAMMIILTGVDLKKSAILSVYFLICLIVFSLGLGMVLSTAMVFFRDVQFLWGVFSMLWMYATPIFYPESILPDKFRFVLEINPLYYFLKSMRMCILDGISPEPMVYIQCAFMAFVMLLLGTIIFRKSQDRFVLYL